MLISFVILGEARRRFDNLKKRFSKKKKAMKDATRSGSGSQEASVAERGLKEYEFLSWLAPFLRLKATDDNLSMHVPPENNDNVEEFDNSLFGSDEESIVVNEDERSDRLNNGDSNSGKNVITKQPSRKRPSPNLQSQEDVIMEKIVKVLEAPSEATQDADDIFGLMVSKEIKGLSERNKRKLKHDINNLIFKYQEEEFENSPRQQHPVLHSSPRPTSTNQWPTFSTSASTWAPYLANYNANMDKSS